MSKDRRLQLIHQWLEDLWPGHLCAVLPVSGDASFRRYFRCLDPQERSLIIMDAPPDLEDCVPFLQVQKDWYAAGIAVPRIYQVDLDRGLMLLEDFGNQTLYEVLRNDADLETLYSSAIDGLVEIQSRAKPSILPPYDAARFRTEMNLFKEWLIGQYLDLVLPDSMWNDSINLLVDNALEQPQVVVHRDYHSKNIMVRKDHQLGLIDFQDAMIGPITYDLVSLLRDCYYQLSDEKVDAYRSRFAAAVDQEHEIFTKWFDWMGVQRHLKAAGIFSRLYLRDNKAGYLKDIPRTLGYIISVSAAYPELHALGQWMSDEVLPTFERRFARETSG